MRTIRLLVVEDSPAYLYLIERAFREHRGEFKWELTIANDGEQAINILFSEEYNHLELPELILLDWNLPKIDGNEVLRRVKEHPNLRRIPVIVFSTSEAESDISDAYASHANGYMTKPGSVTVLEQIVEAIGQFWISLSQLPKVSRETKSAATVRQTPGTRYR